MLAGIDPIIIFELYKKVDVTAATTDKIPVAGQQSSYQFVPLTPIPIYLSENLTGLFISKVDKNIDIGTDTETFLNGSMPDTLQKGIASTVSITLNCKKNSIAMMILSSVIDLLYDKVTSKEYSISFLYGATTIFRGVMHKFSVSQTAENDLMEVNIELSRGAKQPTPQTSIGSVPSSGIGSIPVGAA